MKKTISILIISLCIIISAKVNAQCNCYNYKQLENSRQNVQKVAYYISTNDGRLVPVYEQIEPNTINSQNNYQSLSGVSDLIDNSSQNLIQQSRFSNYSILQNNFQQNEGVNYASQNDIQNYRQQNITYVQPQGRNFIQKVNRIVEITNAAGQIITIVNSIINPVENL
jgi:hypothetical protein